MEETPKFDPENPMEYLLSQIARIPENQVNDLDPKTCLVACEIMEKPLEIISKRAFDNPVWDKTAYLIAPYDLKFLVTSFDALVRLFKNKMQHELEAAKNASKA